MESILCLSADVLVNRILREYFRVPTGSQPALNQPTSPAGSVVQFRRKASLESSLAPTRGDEEVRQCRVVDVEPVVARSISLIHVDLPTVEDAERFHPLLMETDATPFLEIDNTDSVSSSQFTENGYIKVSC